VKRKTDGAQNASGEPTATWSVVGRIYVVRVIETYQPILEGGLATDVLVPQVVCPPGADVKPGDELEFDGGIGTYEVRSVERRPGPVGEFVALVTKK
jgi:hypothetical protein